jgi:hypothetical protein
MDKWEVLKKWLNNKIKDSGTCSHLFLYEIVDKMSEIEKTDNTDKEG